MQHAIGSRVIGSRVITPGVEEIQVSGTRGTVRGTPDRGAVRAGRAGCCFWLGVACVAVGFGGLRDPTGISRESGAVKNESCWSADNKKAVPYDAAQEMDHAPTRARRVARTRQVYYILRRPHGANYYGVLCMLPTPRSLL